MNFIVFFKKKTKVYHTRQKKRRNANCYEQTTGPPTPLHHPNWQQRGFSLQPNQRSNTTRLTLFWLCLLALKTLDNLNVQYKTDSFHFHMNTELQTSVFLTFSWRYKWNRKVYGYAIHLIDHFKTDYTCRNGHFQGENRLEEKKRSKVLSRFFLFFFLLK